MKKTIYIIQVNFKNHNNEETKEFKLDFEEQYKTRFLGWNKFELTDFENAKVYQRLSSAEKVVKNLKIEDMVDIDNILESSSEMKTPIYQII